MTWFEAILIAIVEGITEFLPVSSTGHMVITQAVLGMESTDFVKAFTVNIQFGAILSVIVLYWRRFLQSFNFYFKLGVACLPLILAYFLEDFIDAMLGNVLVVAISLVIGGFFLVFVDRWFRDGDETKEVGYRQAFFIGLFQIISVIPGVSRSAATIIGGMAQRLSRKTAAEFSFFLAVPTMLAASVLKLSGNYQTFSSNDVGLLLIGNLVAFVVALVAIKSFISYLQRHGFRWFGYYRILVGGVIIVLWLAGFDLSLN